MRDWGAQLDDVQVSSDLFAKAKDVSTNLLNITAFIQGIKESIGNVATLSHPDFCSSLSDLNDQMEKLVAKVNSSLVDAHFVQKVDFLSHEWENFKQSWLPALAEHKCYSQTLMIELQSWKQENQVNHAIICLT